MVFRQSSFPNGEVMMPYIVEEGGLFEERAVEVRRA
jgi:hypothetical protein